MIHWPSYNQSFVKRVEIVFSYDFLDIWDWDLEKINENKKRKPYLYPDSFILVGLYQSILSLTLYTNTEGIIKATVGKSLPIDKQPSYSQICRRTNKLNIDIKGSIDDDFVIIAIDSTRESRLQIEDTVDAK